MSRKEHLLFCFPYAGGTADFYNDLEGVADDNVHFIKLEYSGHGERMKEPLYHGFDELTEDLYPWIIKNLENYPEADYALMGYSMGSIAAFDMIRKLVIEDKIRKPVHVFLAAHHPGHIFGLQSVPEEELAAWVKERTIGFGGIDQRLLNNKSFWRLYLPIYTADYRIISSYDFERIQIQTDIPATIFYSEEDIPYEQMKGWKRFFTKECSYVEYEGPHFFIHKYYREMAGLICRKLENVE